MTRVVAAVVSYNTRDLLARCLAALGGVETWVVDNGSSDGSADVVAPPARLLTPGANLGFGRAVNLVAERAGDWDWLAVANADTAPEPGAIDALLAAADRDPGAGALAPRLVLRDGSTQHSVHPFWSPRFALEFNRGRQRRDAGWGDEQCLEGHWDPDRERRVPWALGAFLLVRRAAWDAAGGFDDAQWLYAEDVDLGWRLRAAGWATRYVPSARVQHAESASVGAVWGDARTERWMAASYDQLRRREGGHRARVVAAVNVAGAVARGQREWARLHARGLSARATRARLPRPPG
ncbi:MAG: N-acetylglucosaminyl-diphospho-decaprenol L-rhamnosyltransferase [Solirubrobacteraceae bacterium]|nr:N-acetylglucosaminyl-diphospho-decaprenol L-rhamnosyltransferase [Solirubrobacteraceae bacterium]